MCGKPRVLGAQSLSPREALGSPLECPSPRGLLPAPGSVTPHVQGHGAAANQVRPHQYVRPSFLPMALPSSSPPADANQPDLCVRCPDGGGSCGHQEAWVGLVSSHGSSRAAELRPRLQGSRWTVATVAAPVGHALHCLVAAWPAPEVVSSCPPTRSRLFLKPPIPCVRPGSSILRHLHSDKLYMFCVFHEVRENGIYSCHSGH